MRNSGKLPAKTIKVCAGKGVLNAKERCVCGKRDKNVRDIFSDNTMNLFCWNHNIYIPT